MKLTNDGHQPTRESTSRKTTNQASGITSELPVMHTQSRETLTIWMRRGHYLVEFKGDSGTINGHIAA